MESFVENYIEQFENCKKVPVHFVGSIAFYLKDELAAVLSKHGIKIGNDCQIGTRVGIFTHSSHNSIRYYNKNYNKVPFQEHKGRIKGSVEIGDNTFIGANSIIMPNTKIGKGCIVAGFSYVQGKFDDFSIISGNPAKKVGDVRKIDYKFLKSNPDLIESYLTYFNFKSIEDLKNSIERNSF